MTGYNNSYINNINYGQYQQGYGKQYADNTRKHGYKEYKSKQRHRKRSVSYKHIQFIALRACGTCGKSHIRKHS